MSLKTKNQSINHILSNSNIFDIIWSRVKAGNNGCTVFLPHVCNNIDSFEAGFAAQIAEKFPIVKQDYHLLGKTFLKQNLGYSQIIKVFEDSKFKHKLYIVNMISQNGTKNSYNLRPLNYFALVKSMNMLSSFVYKNTGFSNGSEKIEIHCPKFGSGLAGGNWNFISDLIEDIWGKFFVTVYNYKPNNK